MALPKPIRAPELTDELAPFVGPLTGILEARRIEGGAFGAARVDAIRCEQVHVRASAFDESKLTNLRWIDVLCERSTLSMIDWRGALLTRTLVRGCRLTGARFAEARLEDVRFVECHLDYAAFGDARLTRVSFESCQLREADFHGADLKGTQFVDCDLARSDFTRAKLAGTDVSRSELGGVTLVPADARGLVVNREQACALAVLFGLIVRD